MTSKFGIRGKGVESEANIQHELGFVSLKLKLVLINILKKMSKYFDFRSQKNIPDATLSQHENFVPINPITTNFDRTSLRLLHKTYENFLGPR